MKKGFQSIIVCVIILIALLVPSMAQAATDTADQKKVQSGDFVFTLDKNEWTDPHRSVRSLYTYQNTVATGTSISFMPIRDMKFSDEALVTCVDLVTGLNGYDDYAILGDTEFDSPYEIDTRAVSSLTDCITGFGTHYASYYLLKGTKSCTFVAGIADSSEDLKLIDSVVKAAKCTTLPKKTTWSVTEAFNLYSKKKNTADLRIRGRITSIDKKRQSVVFTYKKKKLRVYLGFNVDSVKKGQTATFHLLQSIQKDPLDKKTLWVSAYKV